MYITGLETGLAAGQRAERQEPVGRETLQLNHRLTLFTATTHPAEPVRCRFKRRKYSSTPGILNW